MYIEYAYSGQNAVDLMTDGELSVILSIYIDLSRHIIFSHN